MDSLGHILTTPSLAIPLFRRAQRAVASSQLFRKLNFYKQKGFWALSSPVQEPQPGLCLHPGHRLLPCREGQGLDALLMG